jgi:predicted DNA-binding transcriptional regulator AlpA
MTVDEVASLLRVSKWHVYELAKVRTRSGDVRSNPLPCLRIGSLVRFRKSDVDAWLEKLVLK